MIFDRISVSRIIGAIRLLLTRSARSRVGSKRNRGHGLISIDIPIPMRITVVFTTCRHPLNVMVSVLGLVSSSRIARTYGVRALLYLPGSELDSGLR